MIDNLLEAELGGAEDFPELTYDERTRLKEPPAKTVYLHAKRAIEDYCNVVIFAHSHAMGCHRFYKRTMPQLKGLKHSEQLYMQVLNEEALDKLKTGITVLRESLAFEPDSALDIYAARMLLNFPEQWTGPFAEQGRICAAETALSLAINKAKFGIPNYKSIKPTSQVPFASLPMPEHFEDRIQEANLELGDLLKIYPEPELECLRLGIGRGLAGPDNSKPIGSDEKLNKRWKAALITVGAPSIGKSAFFDKLKDALTMQGYTTSTFASLDDRFGMGSVVTADFAMCDDTNEAQLTSFIKSNIFKTIVTNGDIRTEMKNRDSIVETCTAVLFVSANAANAYELSVVDEGAHARLFLLGNYTLLELSTAYGDKDNWVFPALLKAKAKELDCDEQTIMLWLARKCLDEYIALPNDGRSAEARMLELKPKFRERAINETLTSYAQAIALACKVQNVKLGGLTTKNLAKAVHAFLLLCFSSDSHAAKSAIKADYFSLGKPLHHPWRVIGCLSLGSGQQIEKYISLAVSASVGEKEFIKHLLDLSCSESLATFGKSSTKFASALSLQWNNDNVIELAEQVIKLDDERTAKLASGKSALDWPEGITLEERAKQILEAVNETQF